MLNPDIDIGIVPGPSLVHYDSLSAFPYRRKILAPGQKS